MGFLNQYKQGSAICPRGGPRVVGLFAFRDVFCILDPPTHPTKHPKFNKTPIHKNPPTRFR